MSNLIDQNNKEIVKADIKVFECDLGSIRVALDDNNEPIFCLKDVCSSLGITDTSNASRALQDEFGKGPCFSRPLETNGGIQNYIFITEPQLYFILMRSNKEKSKPFRQWVLNEVLPSIRKNGGYIMGQENMTELEVIANALVLANNVIQNKSKELEALKELRKREEPLVNFANKVANSSNCISVGEFAKLLKDESINIGQNKLFKWFRENGYLMDNNIPYQNYINSEYFKVIEQTYTTPYGDRVSLKTLITGKGQIYFTEKLRLVYGKEEDKPAKPEPYIPF